MSEDEKTKQNREAFYTLLVVVFIAYLYELVKIILTGWEY